MDTGGRTFEQVWAENIELRRQVEELRRQLEAANDRIAELERAAARQAAPFRRREQKKIPPAERKTPGRKPGHFGAYRQQPDRVDCEIERPLPDCPHCHGPLKDRKWLVQHIEEIPPLQPQVIRLTTWSGECPHCGEVHSTHPLQTSRAQGAASNLLGPRALALAALLNKHLGLTVRKSCKVLRDLCGLSLTPGGLAQAMQRVAQKVEYEYDALIDQLRASPAVFADETSWWVGGPSWWLWTFTTPTTTLYQVNNSRGSDVVKATLGEDFPGVLVSDCLASYDPIDCRKHKCIAHHLQAISKAEKRPDMRDLSYLRQWRLFFATVLALYQSRPEMADRAFEEERGRVEAWCDRLIKQSVTQAGDVAVQNRLAKQWKHLLGCLYEPAAEPTNNRAERSLRPAVIARKLSCGNKTEAGSRAFAILASLAETCSQQQRDFVDFLVQRCTLDPVLAG